VVLEHWRRQVFSTIRPRGTPTRKRISARAGEVLKSGHVFSVRVGQDLRELSRRFRAANAALAEMIED
jgi:hypothetical protein